MKTVLIFALTLFFTLPNYTQAQENNWTPWAQVSNCYSKLLFRVKLDNERMHIKEKGEFNWKIQFQNHYGETLRFRFGLYENAIAARSAKPSKVLLGGVKPQDIKESSFYVMNKNNITIKIDKVRFGNDLEYDDCEKGGAIKVDYGNSPSNNSSSNDKYQERSRLVELGNKHVKLNEFVSALYYYEEAQKIEYNEGVQKAIRGIKKRIEADKKANEVIYNNQTTNNSSVTSEALDVLETILFPPKGKVSPVEMNKKFGIAIDYYHAKDFEKAKKIFEWIETNYNGRTDARSWITMINDEQKKGDYKLGIQNRMNKNFIKALYYLKKAAEQGDVRAQNDLGVMYGKGEGMAYEDYEKAVYWYRKAAEQGFAMSQFNLGNLYRKGEGVNKDYEMAIYWYRKAAEQGFNSAQFSLGLRYANGEGVDRNYQKASHWYKIACENGHNKACRFLEDLKATKLVYFAYVKSKIPLRAEPNVNSKEIYKCPENAKVEVLDNSRKLYYKIKINGHVGFISKHYLKMK